MLIKCPECNNEISDKADRCIHCGCPIIKEQKENVCIINGVEYDLCKFFCCGRYPLG